MALGAGLQFAAEGAVEDGGEQGVELGGGFALVAFQGVYFGMEGVEFGDDAALFVKGRYGYRHVGDHALIDRELTGRGDCNALDIHTYLWAARHSCHIGGYEARRVEPDADEVIVVAHWLMFAVELNEPAYD